MESNRDPTLRKRLLRRLRTANQNVLRAIAVIALVLIGTILALVVWELWLLDFFIFLEPRPPR
jgi:hypothetical protein